MKLLRAFPLHLPVLLDPPILPARARLDVRRSRGKVSRQQVEVDTRRRHNGSQPRQRAHVAPRWSSRSPANCAGNSAWIQQRGTNQVDVLRFSWTTPRKRGVAYRAPGCKWRLTFCLGSADGSHGSRRPTTFLREKTLCVTLSHCRHNPPPFHCGAYLFFPFYIFFFQQFAP